MKTKLLFSVVLALLCYNFSFAQITMTPSDWENAKKNGQLDGKKPATISSIGDTIAANVRITPNFPAPAPAATSCACWQTRDSTWDIVPMVNGTPPDYRNDDFSSPSISLPFTFCLYGSTWNSCFINNNGNVSFGGAFGTFTASGFPTTGFEMVAPFWADVDTRNVLSGLPHYKITPTYMIVQWDSVGYYSAYADKVNTFQLIITDGSDPIVPGGNVSFCYKDMQWTTGDASGGVNGFNGSDAVVGANRGNSVDYIQFGAFNQPGGNYNGPQGANSGIDWLDYQTFAFDACNANTNIPPTASGITICDTLHLCVGDTLPLNVLFFSPEAGQTTTITVSAPGVNDYTIVSNTSGNTAQLISYLAGTMLNIGYNNILITATDNGTPTGVTSIPIVIEVSIPPVTTISPDTSVCSGPVQLFATGGGTYDWVPASGLSCTTCPNPVASPAVTTTYTVGITNGCTVTRTVTVFAPPQVTVSPATNICQGASTQISASGGNSYSWSPATGLSNPNIANPIASPTVSTVYTVTVTYIGHPACAATNTVSITVTPLPIIVASNDTSICSGTPANLFATGGTTYSWSPSTGLSNPNIANPVATPASTTTYVVTASNGNCQSTEPVVITVQFALANAGPDTTICQGQSALLTATGGVSYSWTPTTGLNNPNIQNPIATPSVTTTYTCTVTNATGCTDVDIATVTISPSPISVFSVSPVIIFADSTYYFTDLSTGGVISWAWLFGDGGGSTLQNPSHLYEKAGTYRVCLITANSTGCLDTSCADVTVLPREVEAPNVFTPNGDGTNDLLIFKNLDYYPNTALQIYDRWGILVYENGNYLNDWNGKKNGNGGECVDGTYYYVLSGINLKTTLTGFVQLIRGK